MHCPTFEQLVDFLDGRLALAPAAAVERHVALGCIQCDGDVAWSGRVKRVAASDDSVEPPPWVLKRALRGFDSERGVASIVSLANRVIASLVFDSLRRPTLAMSRAIGVDDRQLMYEAEPYSIDLQVASLDQARADLSGQILRRGELMFESVAGLTLNLMREGSSVLSAVTNDRGEFRVGALEGGSYDLKIEARDVSITIVGLPIA
jgi:hypothetical protein